MVTPFLSDTSYNRLEYEFANCSITSLTSILRSFQFSSFTVLPAVNPFTTVGFNFIISSAIAIKSSRFVILTSLSVVNVAKYSGLLSLVLREKLLFVIPLGASNVVNPLVLKNLLVSDNSL